MSRHSLPPAPTSGTWREGDSTVFRKFASLGARRLENGEILPFAALAYGTWDEPDKASSNAVLILHALTDDARVCGEAAPGQPTSGRWEQIVGPGRIVDTDRCYVMAANVLDGCQSSMGLASPVPDGAPWGLRFPMISTRDQVCAESRLANLLGIDEWSIVVGTSLDEHRAIGWAVSYLEHMHRLVVVASSAQTTTDQAAWTHTQIRAVRLNPAWRGGDCCAGPGPIAGLTLARQIAHTACRSPSGLDERFGRIPQNNEDPLHDRRLTVESYLDYHGEKIVHRFDTGSYVALCRAMLSHGMGRDRDDVVETLKTVTACTLIVTVDSDRPFFPEQVWQMAAGISGAFYREIHSDHGHDGFLIGHGRLTALLDEFLNKHTPSRASSFV